LTALVFLSSENISTLFLNPGEECCGLTGVFFSAHPFVVFYPSKLGFTTSSLTVAVLGNSRSGRLAKSDERLNP
jgi:hypothetical protein